VQQNNEISLYHDIIIAVEQENDRKRVDVEIMFEAAVTLASIMNRLNLLHLASDFGGVIWCLEKLRRYLLLHKLNETILVERYKRSDGDVFYYFADNDGNPVVFVN